MTEIRLADAKLTVAETESITVTDEDGNEIARIETNPMVYDSDSGTTITYHSGALIRQDGEHPVMFREPDFVVTADELRLPVVRLSPAGEETIGGQTDAKVHTQYSKTNVSVSDSIATVTLQLGTSQTDAWVQYFEQFQNEGPVTGIDENEGEVTVTIETDRVHVIDNHVVVSFR